MRTNGIYDQDRFSNKPLSEKAKHAAGKAGKMATAVVATGALAFGTVELGGYAIDNSPTTKLQRSYQEEAKHNSEAFDAARRQIAAEDQAARADQVTAEEIQQQLPNDPNIHVK